LRTPDGGESVVHLRASDDPSTLGVQDVVVFTVKYPALPAALAQARPLIGAHTRCIFAMNGLPWWFGETISPELDAAVRKFIDPQRLFVESLPSERWAHCVITSGNVASSPGCIVNTTPGLNRMAIGLSRPVEDATLDAFASVATRGGYFAEIVTDIRQRVWSKLLINAGLSSVSVLVDKSSHDTCANPESRAVVISLMNELIGLSERLGITIAADATAMTDPARIPHHVTSFLQDLRADRPLEIRTGILAVREIAATIGYPVPAISTVSGLLCGRAKVAQLPDDRAKAA